jgi:hypothetical protein
MATSRTTPGDVQAVLLKDYDSDRKPSLARFIRMAKVVTDRVAGLSGQRGMQLTSDELLEVETLLAAHFYCMTDKPLQQKSTEGASGAFQGQTGKGFEATMYGQAALRLDWSGSLEAIDKRKIARCFWGGVTPDELDDQGNYVIPDPGPGAGPY